MNDLLLQAGSWVRGVQYQAAMAIVATILVIFGHDINKAIKHLVAKQHFVLRSITFIFVCAFGYGMATVWLTSLLAQQFSKIPTLYLMPSIIGIFIVLGIYAQKQKHI